MSKVFDVIGIDLGTTNSVVSVMKGDEIVHTIFDGSSLLPSVVHILENSELIVGQKAKNILAIEPNSTVASIKRKMGSEESVTLRDKVYSPQEISSFILKRIKEDTSKEFGIEAKECVITVPAYFNEKQRESTVEAAKLAGLEVLRIINEPTAAALTFGVDKDEDAVYVIYDLGGGTFDVSVIENSEGMIEVISTAGDNNLGGDDFDEKLADFIWKKSKNSVEKSKKLDIKLLQLAEKVKKELSFKDKVEIKERFFARVGNSAVHLELEITRDEFEELIKDDIKRTVDLLKKAVEDAEYEIDEVDTIILTGGSSRIPLITNMINKECDKMPALIDDPDRAVSKGALLQALMLKGENVDSILIDITPYSLGTAVLDDNFQLKMKKMVEKNSPIPIKKSDTFHATIPYQETFEIRVYQGDDEEVLENNHLIGDVLLRVKDPVEWGDIEVTFFLNQNGILKIEGVYKETKEKVEGEFNTKITKVVSKKDSNTLADYQKRNFAILTKIEKILSDDKILDEDKEDLKELKKQYLAQEDEEKIKEIEEEIIDTIFYIEEQ